MQNVPFSGSGGPFGKAGGKPVHNPVGLVYRFGPFELDVDRYELRRQGLRLRMAPAPMELLMLLIERRNTLVDREAITARLWSDSKMVDVDQGINTAMRRVREVLRDDPSQPRFIETVVGKGYRFVADVQESRSGPTLAVMPEKLHVLQSPEQSKESSPPSEPEESRGQAETATAVARPRRGSIGRAAVAGAALLLVLGMAYAGWLFVQHRKMIRYATSLTQITANDSDQRVTAAAISPDGKWIAYADIDNISLQLLQNGKTVPLKAPEALRVDRITWFPDQTKILVSGVNDHSAQPEIWTVFITGGAPQIFRKDARNGVPSPDGARIAFTAGKDSELWTAGADGDGARPLIIDTSGKVFLDVFWSGEGKRVSYLTSLTGLGTNDYQSADAGSGKILASQKDVAFKSACALADGRLFFLRDSPAELRDEYSLWEVDTNRATGAFLSPPTRIYSLDQAKAFGLAASDDGSRISVMLEKGQPHVYVGTLQQPGPTLGEVQRLTYDTRTDYPGSWLHDNQTVVFESNRAGVYRLYQQHLQDRTPQELNTGTAPSVLPQVTPDGKWILYDANPDVRPSSNAQLFRIPATGGTPEQVETGGAFEEFRCPLLGGSTCVLRKSDGRKELIYYKLDPITGRGRELARTSWLPHVTSDWTVAPDGSAVALTLHDISNPRIRIVPLGGGSDRRERELAVHGTGMLSGISWSADGEGWYIATDTAGGTSIVYVNQLGESHTLRASPSSTWAVPSPDGSKLAFVDQAVDSNVWMWQIEQKR